MRIEAVQRLSLVIVLFVLVEAEAGTYYVSTQGNDSNPGTAAQPFRTITHAYGVASPGTTILVMPGTYTDYTSGWGIHLGTSGSASSPIVLRSQTPGAAVIDGQNASDRNVGFYIDGNFNIVDGFEIKHAPKGGITIWANNNAILHCNIHNNGNAVISTTQGRDGIYSDEGTSGNVYTGNYIHHNGATGSNLDHGLYLCGQNEMVNNNLLLANAACGLQVAGYSTVKNLKVYNNVLALNGTDGIILWQSLSGIDIRNNIFYSNGHWAIGSYDAHGSGVSVDHNLTFGNGAGDYNFADGGSDYSYELGTALYSDPLFANQTPTDFDSHLKAGSPGIQNAVNLYSLFTTDIAGATRQATGPWDLGVYKCGSVTATGTLAMVSVTASVPTAIIGTTNYGAFTFTRTGDTGSPLTVNYSLGGTAVKWDDYRRPETGDMPSSVVIPAGAASCTMNIWAVTNETGANPEFLTLTLSADSSYQVSSPGSATINIVSDGKAIGTTGSNVVGIHRIAGGINLTWNSVPGRIYRVAAKNQMTAPWVDLSGNITADGPSTSWTDTMASGNPQCFYRVYTSN